MPFTLEEANAELDNVHTPEQLRALISQISVSADGTTTILFSGTLANGQHTLDVVKQLTNENPSVRSITKTAAAHFLDDTPDSGNLPFQDKLDELFGADWRTQGSVGNRFLYGTYVDGVRVTADGVWDDVSGRFAAATVGEVRVIGPRANASGVLGATELRAMLQGTSVTSIEGIPLAELKAVEAKYGPNGLTEVFNRVRLSSELSIVLSGFNASTEPGGGAMVAAGDYFNAEISNPATYLQSHPEAHARWQAHWNGLSEAERSARRTLVASILTVGEGLQTPTSGGARVLNKLGVLGAVVSFSMVANQAAAAEASGNSTEAQNIMAEWAVDLAGSAAGEAVGAVLGGIAVGAAAVAGVALSAPLAAAFVFGAALAGGFFGADGAVTFYRLLGDQDANGQRDIIDRLRSLLYGADGTITTPLPADLNGDRFTINAGIDHNLLIGNANADIAWRYALRELNTFVVTDVSYAAHNTDGSLDLLDPATGLGGMSERYIADRAAMLTWKLAYDKRGAQDDDDAPRAGTKPYIEDWDTNQRQGNWDYIDLTREYQPLKLAVDGTGVSLHDHQVVFGSNRADTIEGAGAADWLYGMGGDDSVKGYGGHDYIEGNSGNDSLEGGSGHDTLIGGTGNDTLVGEAGMDRLIGGLGSDSYSFAGSWGVDTIEDIDGLGRIEIDGIGVVTGAGALKLAEGVWQTPDKQLTYLVDDSSATLKIVVAGRADAVVVNGWTPTKNLGITLAAERTFPGTTTTLMGDYRKLVDGIYYVRDEAGNYVFDGPQANAADIIKGSAGSDFISGMGGNDGLSGAAGDDVLDGGAGSDVLLGGAGADLVMGGGGNDFVFGAGFAFTNTVSSTSQAPLPSVGTELARGFSWVVYATGISSTGFGSPFSFGGVAVDTVNDQGNVIDGGDGTDYLFGGDKSDVIVGGVGNDLGFGMAGDDFISGGVGDDELLGDGSLAPGLFTTIPAAQHGNDVLVGGAGHDTLVGGGGADNLLGGTGVDYLYGDNRNGQSPEQDGNDYLDGGADDDWLEGGGGDDVLVGGAGRDVLNGGAGNDLLIIEGNDSIYGGSGNDTYLFRSLSGSQVTGSAASVGLLESGGAETLFGESAFSSLSSLSSLSSVLNQVSTIWDAEGTDVLSFDGAAAGTIVFVQDGRTLVAAGSTHLVEMGRGVGLTSLTIAAEGGGPGTSLQQVIQADNSYGLIRSRVWLSGQGAVPTSTLTSSQSLNGNERHELLEGGSGADVIVAGEGADVVRGGKGNDTLRASKTTALDTDADVFLFDRGDGVDQIVSQGGSASDVIRFGAGIQLADLVVSRQTILTSEGSAPGLVVDYGLSDRIEVTGLAEDTLSRIEFHDGSSISIATLTSSLSARGTGSEASETIRGSQGKDVIRGLGGADLLYGNGGDDVIDGGAGNDELYGGSGNSVLVGGAGSDKITVEGGVNLVHGGAGNDTLTGSAGKTTYYFGLGDGQDVINEYNAFNRPDTIILGAGISPGNLVVERGTGLTLRIAGTADSLRIPAVDGVLFDDGTFWSQAELAAVAVPARDSYGQMFGTTGADVLLGTGSIDYLDAGSGDDLIDGGPGNDTLRGGSGSDRYVLKAGGGSDLIYDAVYQYGAINTAGDTDTIEVHAEASQIRLVRGGSGNASLMVEIVGTADRMEVYGWFNQDNNESTLRIQPADGPAWDTAAIRSRVIEPSSGELTTVYGSPMADALVGSGGSDTLYGNAGSDTLDGGSGNDVLRGGSGADTYLFGYGSGSDAISEIDYTAGADGTVDIIQLKAGVLPADVTIVRNAAGYGSITLTLAGSSDQLLVGGIYSTSERVEQVRFHDGTIWDLTVNPLGPITGSVGADNLVGTVYDDTILGGAGNDRLDGDVGNDTLYGSEGNDILIGGTGLDVLDGGAGDDNVNGDANDRIMFGRGDGHDTIGSGAGGGSTLVFKTGILVGDLTLNSGPDGTLTVGISGGDGALTLPGWLNSSYASTRVKRFVFADGTEWTESDIHARVSTAATPGSDYLFAVPTGGTLSGGAGKDELWGQAGNDTLDGGDGDDKLFGANGTDTLVGGAGMDVLDGGAGSDTYVFAPGFGQDTIEETGDSVGPKIDVVTFTAGIEPQQVRVTGDDPTNPMLLGNLYLSVEGTSDRITLTRWLDPTRSSVDEVRFANGIVWNRADLISAFYRAQGGGTVEGSLLADTLTGGDASDQIDGAGGADQIFGGAGDDVLIGGAGDDLLDGGTGSDSLYGGTGDDTYTFGPGSGLDTIGDFDRAGGGHDRVLIAPGVLPADVSVSRTDVHIALKLNGSEDSLQIIWYPHAGLRIEEVVFGNGVVWSAAELEAKAQESITQAGTSGSDFIVGTPGTDVLLGGQGDDQLVGGAGDDRLEGGDGNDRLEAGLGQDVLIGNSGDDTFVVSGADDMVIEFAGGGVDLVEAEASYVLPAHVENLTLLSQATSGTGNEGNNHLVGNESANTLAGLGGNDQLNGRGGNDILFGGHGSDTYHFSVGWGVDRVDDLGLSLGAGLSDDGATDAISFGPGVDAAAVSYRISGSDLIIAQLGSTSVVTVSGYLNAPLGLIEQIRFSDGTVHGFAEVIAGASTQYGTDGADTLYAIFSGGTLYGRAGADWLGGGEGNDSLFGEDGDDVLAGGGGHDLLYGGVGSDDLRGEAGDDLLDGGAGDDWLTGGYGNDNYVVDSLGDSVSESDGDGVDTVQAGVSYTLPTGVENLTLTGQASIDGTGNGSANLLVGNAAPNTLNGGAGNDTLDGGAGADTLVGGSGNDLYLVDSVSDSVVEAASAGTDTVRSVVSYTLAVNVENLELAGAESINGTGNAAANRLTGNAADNVLDGGAGNDTMIGGVGNDTYVVDATGDVVTEIAGEGVDLILSTVTLTLASHVENMRLMGTSAINGSGNGLDNTLTGNGANNTLNGGAGNDNMAGGLGNDTYVVDAVGDVVQEATAGGTDLVQSSVSWTLPANVENLTLTGTSAINATGNELANRLTGNSGANLLDGGAGNDTMVGGAGNDTYVVDSTADVVTEGSNAGTDTVLAAVNWTLGGNVENLTLTGTANINGTGNTLVNTIRGNAGNNTLSGGSGNDTMIGGAGNDTYVVDATGDVVTELAGEGVDQVNSSVTYTLAGNVENLTLTGTSAINGTGNAIDNVLVGNSANNTLTGGAGNDTLDGGSGNDTMVGGAGDDTYVVNVTTDVVTEAASEGVDTVRSSVTLTLGNNVENLQLLGTSAISGTGNALNNALTGNSAANTLTGAAGNDTLDGAGGNDTLVGGAGADSYIFGRGWGTDTVQENDSTSGVVDQVLFGADITQAQTSYRRSGNNLEVSIAGTTDKLVVRDWYLGTQYQAEQFRYVDGTVVTNTQVASLLSAMASFDSPAQGDFAMPVRGQNERFQDIAVALP
jgi:Ca2+-binding RTX toxin-like protein